MNHIFTDGEPVWTNKEVLVAFGSTAAVLVSTLVPAFFALYRVLSSSLRHRLAAANHEVHGLEVKTRELELKLKSIEDGIADPSPLNALLEDARKQIDQLNEENGSAQTAAEKLGADLDAIQAKLVSEQKRVKKALGAKGFSWTERVLYNAPEFRSLEERKMPIVSVLNLKGGVGKTTLTANLGAALARLGWKVLLIDLDLQGSLTNLFTAEQDQGSLEEQRRFIGDFLGRSFDAEYPNLLDYTHPILGSRGSSLVGTIDTLAYAETNLTVRWLLREGNRDPRFILRRELHLKRISNAFDIVLIDCPPLINICGVNALAASDSVLIPVMPSKATTDRVPVLLRRIMQFRENINDQLKVLGLVANRTFGAELSGDEKNRLSELEMKAKNTWGEDIPRLETFIRQSTEMRRAEDEHRPLATGDKMAEVFDDLAREIVNRLPTFCQPTGIPTSAPVEVVS